MRSYRTDILIIGGGAAGIFSAIKLSKDKELEILIVDKGHIKRSGCLAGGINAINAYLDEDADINQYVEYIKEEFEGIVREDLVRTIAEKLNSVTKDIESYGLTIFKDSEGNYVKRGKRSIKINGENIKPILERKLKESKNVKVINFLNVIDYIKLNNEIIGAIAIDLKKEEVVFIYSKVTVIATGGAAGIYRETNEGELKNRTWYPPFNIGSGYGMGIRAGAEMTSFEMRFIALRVKETIAPTGTVAQGINSIQINKNNDDYMKKYKDKSTAMRLFATVQEEREGRGPCYLKTVGIDSKIKESLKKAYLNMAPAEVLRWVENSIDLTKENLEITGTEPYIVGGHSLSGYWIDKSRRTTIKGLYAIGDVAGGSPKKYVTGAFAEGEIAAENIIKNKNNFRLKELNEYEEENLKNKILEPLFRVKRYEKSIIDLEEELKNLMENKVGGKTNFYEYEEEKLIEAQKEIKIMIDRLDNIGIKNIKELNFFYEVREKIFVAMILIEHLLARKERRIRIYQENKSYPFKSEEYNIFINSLYENGDIKIIKRKIGAAYEY